MTVVAAHCKEPLHCLSIPLINNYYDQSYVRRHCETARSHEMRWYVNPHSPCRWWVFLITPLRQHAVQGHSSHATLSPSIFLSENLFSFFNSCKCSLGSLEPWSCNPISLALWMEGSLRESIKKASPLLLLCNLSNPVGLITHREQKSIHLITKRCDKNTVTCVYGGKLLARWNSLGREERNPYRKQYRVAP